jgi:hypothetical protein
MIRNTARVISHCELTFSTISLKASRVLVLLESRSGFIKVRSDPCEEGGDRHRRGKRWYCSMMYVWEATNLFRRMRELNALFTPSLGKIPTLGTSGNRSVAPELDTGKR